jgi:LmbE family N-acetylglucosaminyl deacetylase
VYLTDGRKGYDVRGTPFASDLEREAYENCLVEKRKAEARAVCTLLGFQSPRFLDFPDTEMTATSDAVDRVADIAGQLFPDTVFLPFLTDPHPDHWTANHLFLEAAARIGMSDRTECWGYEVWAPLQANSTVDITDAMKEKEAAMERYKSQAAASDLRRAFRGLSTYRSLFAQNGRGYAEAYWVTDLARYRSLHEALVHFGKQSTCQPAEGTSL